MTHAPPYQPRVAERTEAGEPVIAIPDDGGLPFDPGPTYFETGSSYPDGDFYGAPSCCEDRSGQACGFDLGRFWVSGEYLLWWMDGFSTPPLVTTSPDGTDRDVAGVLGQPDTSVLFGGNELVDSVRSGGRVRLGYWFDDCETSGVEGTWFGLEQEVTTFAAASPNPAILARPFFNLEPGVEAPDSELVAFPNLFEGNIRVRSESTLEGIEVLYRHSLARECSYRIDFVAGWRYNRLDEALLISDFRTVVSTDTGLAVGTTLGEFDRFTARNRFHGGELGIVAEMRLCRWSLEGSMKLALGSNNAEVTISGETTATTPVPGGPPQVVTTPTGLLAQQTNIGTFENDEFAVIPELGVTLGYDISCRLRATFGYTFMYWSRVARPGDQIDTDLNLSQLAPGGLQGSPRPQFPWAITDAWAQGLNFGLEYRF